jgi:hypothetical protein
MDRLQRDVVILSLIENLKEKGSWCGETHIQKATYFLQELFDIPLGFEFILYKHGPFSFDLSDELTAMRADMLIKLQPQPRPYGHSLVPSNGSESIKKHFSSTLKKYDHNLQFVANKFRDRGVAELERLATALYVTQEIIPDGSSDLRAKCIIELKPHVNMEEARAAVKEVDEIIRESPKRK